VNLRTLLDGAAFNRQEQGSGLWRVKQMTPAQRGAVSAHWSAELRAKVAAAKQAERQRSVIALDYD
jgi:SH3-like domain-containing protein